MEFGKLQHIDNIDFTLPPDDPVTEALWSKLRLVPREPLHVHIGGTEWGRTSWVGRAYPMGTKPKDFLSSYSRQFNTVELNTLFYGLQSPAVIQRWASSVGNDFRFCPKFPETISHKLQLVNTGRETAEFVEALQHFGRTLGPSFLLLSDRFGPDQAGVLQHYVRQLPPGFPACVELRSEDWFRPAAKENPLIRETWEQLLDAGIGTVITDVAGRRDVLHMRLTNPVAFIRFVTNSLHPTDYQRADAWVERIRDWAGKGLREVYIFVHSPEELTSPEMMKYLIGRMNERLGMALHVPNLVNGGQPGNLSLF